MSIRDNWNTDEEKQKMEFYWRGYDKALKVLRNQIGMEVTIFLRSNPKTPVEYLPLCTDDLKEMFKNLFITRVWLAKANKTLKSDLENLQQERDRLEAVIVRLQNEVIRAQSQGKK